MHQKSLREEQHEDRGRKWVTKLYWDSGLRLCLVELLLLFSPNPVHCLHCPLVLVTWQCGRDLQLEIYIPFLPKITIGNPKFFLYLSLFCLSAQDTSLIHISAHTKSLCNFIWDGFNSPLKTIFISSPDKLKDPDG